MARMTLAAAFCLAVLMGSPAAQDQIEWLDDGTVLLRLGPDYDDAVIETSVDALGSILGGEDRPYDGVTITILTHDEGPNGPISGPLAAFAPVWEALSGGTVEIALVPITDLYAEMMLDLERGIGRYDAIVVPAFVYGDLIAGDHILPVDPYVGDPRFPRWSYDAMPDAVRNLYSWDGVGYGVPNDADGQVLYYRRDVLTDPEWQRGFAAEYGYPLPVPPETWQQVLDISRYFTGVNWDDGDHLPDYGMVLHLRVGEQGHFHFQSLSAAFTVNPGAGVDRTHNVYWFDPVDMTPLINSPGHVAALEHLIALNETGPIEQIGWRLPEAWNYFLRGKAVFIFSWGDLGSLCQDERRSRVRGQCGVAVLPGAERYWDLAQEAWVENTTPSLVGNTTGSSWHGVVSALSENPDAAYSLLALMAIEPVSLWNAQHGWTGVDPGFRHQFLPPAGTADLVDYLEAGWSRADVEDYLDAYHRTFTAPTMLPYLRIRGTAAYWSVLDRNLAAAVGGRMDAQEALDATAAAWEEITDRLGRQQQLEAYRAAIGFSGG